MVALYLAEQKLNDTGSSVKTSRYAAWLNDAFSQVAMAGHVASAKTREKLQSAASNLTAKALGFNHKCRTLEEILRSTPKNVPKLIGFDEEPTEIEDCNVDSISLDKLRVQEVAAIPSQMCLVSERTASSDTNPKQSSVPSRLAQRWVESSKTCNINKGENEPVRRHQVETNGENGYHQEKNGALNNKISKVPTL